MKAYRLVTVSSNGIRAVDCTYATSLDLDARIDAAHARGERVEVTSIGEVPDAGSVGWFGFDEGPVWQGFDSGANWNGWAVPLFTREVAEQVVATLSADRDSGEPDSYFDEDGVIHLFSYWQGYDADDEEAWMLTPPTDAGLYAVGDGFCWNRFEEDEARAQNLAHAFSQVLAEWLTPEEMAEVRTRNKGIKEGICASHDFCDANMAMDEAWRRLFGDTTPVDYDEDAGETMDESRVDIWNRAWDIAKNSGFYAVGGAK